MNIFIKKFFVFLLGLFLILLCIEISLRIVGLLNHYAIGIKSKHNTHTNFSTIYCYGDSYTRGMGAPEGMDYPAQLQKKFLAKKLKYSIINNGLITQNTSQLLEKLQKDINKNRPDIIILLTGGANLWNSWGYKEGINKIISNIKIYKLFKRLIFDIENKKSLKNIDIIQPELEYEKFNWIFQNVKKRLKENPNDAMAYYNMGLFYAHERNIEEAIKWFKIGINANPTVGNNYKGLFETYYLMSGKNSEELLYWLNDEYKKDTTNFHIINMLWGYYSKINDNKEATKWYNKMIYIEKSGIYKKRNFHFEHNTLNYFNIALNSLEKKSIALEMCKNMNIDTFGMVYPEIFIQMTLGHNDNHIFDKNINPVLIWVKKDMIKLIDICKDNNIKLILMTYPLREQDNAYMKTYKLINENIREIAKKEKILLLDNEFIFKQLKNRENYFEPIQNGDHCNEKGYEIIANNLYSLITKKQ
jgi:lysophospholipase L1-like esterase